MKNFLCKKCGWKNQFPDNKRAQCLPCLRIASANWKKRNPQRTKVYRAKWFENRLLSDPDFIKRANALYDAAHPEIKKRVNKARRAKLKNGNVTSADLLAIWERDKGKCRYCGTSKINPRFIPYRPIGFDHVIPFCKGGKHEPKNLVVCCTRCNKAKSIKLISPRN